jgi:hypothetical protein
MRGGRARLTGRVQDDMGGGFTIRSAQGCADPHARGSDLVPWAVTEELRHHDTVIAPPCFTDKKNTRWRLPLHITR